MLTSVNRLKKAKKVYTFEPMLDKNYKNIIYFISITIIATIVAQVYWNIKNYEQNKIQIENQIKLSFDNSIEKYYSEIAKKNISNFPHRVSVLKEDNLWLSKDKSIDSLIDNAPKITTLLKFKYDSLHKIKSDAQFSSIDFFKPKDSLKILDLTSKVFLSFQENNIDLEKIDSIFTSDLKRKNLNPTFGFNFIGSNHFSASTKSRKYKLENLENNYKIVKSNSSFLPNKSTLELHYNNSSIDVYKKIFGSLLLSLLFSIIIISCLLYLFKTIAKQKQIAEIKNDLISNITHEFKTPIATIGVALESIKDFNAIQDLSKTNRYIDMSNNQLFKLNTMVEKLLETASLDSKDIELKLEETNITTLIHTLVEKHKIQSEKEIIFNRQTSEIKSKIDTFHFENAINNVIDNAVKYGGNNITINIESNNKIIISITDNGNELTQEQAVKIFDKFYRVPKGNTHNVKGFGIGLYYTRKIIEKHNGSIYVSLKNGLTTFKISLPHA